MEQNKTADDGKVRREKYTNGQFSSFLSPVSEGAYDIMTPNWPQFFLELSPKKPTPSMKATTWTLKVSSAKCDLVL